MELHPTVLPSVWPNPEATLICRCLPKTTSTIYSDFLMCHNEVCNLPLLGTDVEMQVSDMLRPLEPLWAVVPDIKVPS